METGLYTRNGYHRMWLSMNHNASILYSTLNFAALCLKSSQSAITNICTRHDSVTVERCAKYRCDRSIHHAHEHYYKAQVTLCRSGDPDLYDLKNRGELPVRQSFTVKLCRVGRGCGYDLFMARSQSCVESETSWDWRTQREDIRGQRVGIRGQRMDGRENRISITTTSCVISVTFTFSYISRYAYIYIYLCIYVYLLIIWVYS